MGGNIQKGKSQLESGKKGENYPQLFSAKEKDLKQSANLGSARWFYTDQYLSWEIYNNLSENNKENNKNLTKEKSQSKIETLKKQIKDYEKKNEEFELYVCWM